MTGLDFPEADNFSQLAEKLRGLYSEIYEALRLGAHDTKWVSVTGPSFWIKEPRRTNDRIDTRVFSREGRHEIAVCSYRTLWESLAELDDSEGGEARKWLESQHAYIVARRRAGFTDVDEEKLFAGHSDSLLKILERKMSVGPGWDMDVEGVSASLAIGYHRWMEGICEAIHGYLSGEQLHIALNGKQEINKAYELASELCEILNSPALRKKVGRGRTVELLPNLTQQLKDYAAYSQRAYTHRKDTFLAERLFAASLLRNNYEVFRRPKPGVVFLLMGLPFVKNPLEHKTIERVWSTYSKNRDGHKMYEVGRISVPLFRR